MLEKSRSLIHKLLAALALAATSFALVNPAQAQIGVSVSVNQPGVYGRIDIGHTRPELIYHEPIIVQRAPYSVHQRPIYMRVPPGHYKQWSRYCGQYRACNQPVYFVQDRPRAGHGAPRHEPPRALKKHDRHDHHDHRGKPTRLKAGKHDDRHSRDDRNHGPRGHGQGGHHR